METNVVQTLNKLVQYNNELMGLPIGVIVFLSCIGIGFVVKAIKVIPNNYIPLIVVFWSSIFFMLVAPERGSMSSRIWLGRNFLIGLIIGTAAWLFHRYVLKTLFRKFGSDDTVFITKEQTNEKVDS